MLGNIRTWECNFPHNTVFCRWVHRPLDVFVTSKITLSSFENTFHNFSLLTPLYEASTYTTRRTNTAFAIMIAITKLWSYLYEQKIARLKSTKISFARIWKFIRDQLFAPRPVRGKAVFVPSKKVRVTFEMKASIIIVRAFFFPVSYHEEKRSSIFRNLLDFYTFSNFIHQHLIKIPAIFGFSSPSPWLLAIRLFYTVDGKSYLNSIIDIFAITLKAYKKQNQYKLKYSTS